MESDATTGALHAPTTPTFANDTGTAPTDPSEETTGLYGLAQSMRRLRRTIALYARSSATVVIHGETGTGKELVARAIHCLGGRATAPFVATNVAAIPESLASSELFGHERGAFTGAVARHRGLFEQADHGTLFLDEVAELAPDNQARLLRVLETGEIRPVGSERPRTVSVRLVAATHTPLAPLVAAGLFREDLFFRLQTLVITIPALRERMEDLPRIAEHLLDRLAPEIGRRRLHVAATKRLQAYGWPGNVRQLGNVLRRASVRAQGIELREAMIEEALADEPRARAHIREGATIETIRGVLKQYGGRISPAARVLGMARSTLRERIRRHSIVIEP
jgi:DNA-binding NtrC family response regulator